MSDYRLKPHLAFSSSPGTVAPYKHPKMYALSGSSSNRLCYIGAHGEAMGTKTFTVPNGVTVQFTQPHGYSMSMEMSHLRHGNPVQIDSAWGTVTYNPGDQCNNYYLTKWHGRHTGYASQQDWENAGEDYVGWQRIVTYNKRLTFAFPRHRAFRSVLTLKECIEIMVAKYPSLNEFWCLFCRYDGSSAWSWDAQNGRFLLQDNGRTYTLDDQNNQVEI